MNFFKFAGIFPFIVFGEVNFNHIWLEHIISFKMIYDMLYIR